MRFQHLLLASTLSACAMNCSCVSAAGEVVADGRWVLGQVVAGGEEVPLPQTGRDITAAYLEGDPDRVPVVVGFNADATEVRLAVPPGEGGKIVLEVAEKSQQFPDGRIVLSALDARVDGAKAKLESHPGNHRIGFWTELGDTVNWSYTATRPGMYDVELCYSAAAGGGGEVEVSLGGEKLAVALVATGSWYRYTTLPVGRVYIEKSGELPVVVRGVKLAGAALMNLKALTLRPAPEGEPVEQAADGSIEFDAAAATVHSTLMQYEHNPKKLCLGYWANPQDWASWDFVARRPGSYRVELTQGCGKGQGGSQVAVSLAGQTFEFTVEDTGGFQNWQVRELGEVTLREAGNYRLEVRPQDKKGVAVMDVRRLRLIPAG